MPPKKINFKPGHVSSLSVLLAMGLISFPLASVAQNNYKSSGYISQELNSTVKQSRQAGTEIILRQTALQLLDLRETTDSNESSPDTLKPAVPGVLPTATDYLHPNKLGRNSQGNNYDFRYLPAELGKPKDANGIPLAYCAFNFPNASASENRLGGSNRLQPFDAKDALGFAIISAGANGRFDLSCEHFRNSEKGKMKNETDDLYVIQSFHDITYAGANSRYVEKSVDKYDDLNAIHENFRYDGQIRWVKKTNQFFRYDQTTKVWRPLNAGFQPNTSATDDPTQIELNWLSGSMGVGTEKQANIGGNNERAILTLGKKRQDKSGTLAANLNYLAGIGFNNNSDALFAYIGLLNDNTFALRLGNDNRILLDNVGNLKFFGKTITVTGRTTFNDELTANGGLNATTGTFSGLLSANGGFNATTGSFSGLLQANGGFNATTGSFSGLLQANGGLNASTGNFSGLLNANGGLKATEGTFTGNLSAMNGTFNGVLSGGSITTGGSLSAGSISTAGTLSSGALSATTGIFSGLLTANGGLNASTGSFSGLLQANGGLSATEGNFTGNLSAMNGSFNGVLSGGSITTGGSLSAGSISTAGTLSSGALSATTGIFSGLLTANGGLDASTGSFSGLLNANGGLNASTGNFSGLLTANGGLNATTGSFSGLLQANGGLNATTGSFSGLLNANGGLNATTGSFSGLLQANGGLNATTGSFSGLLQANGGLNATTGNFSGLLSANGGLSVNGGLIANNGLDVRGQLNVTGTLQVNGINLSDPLNLNVYGYTVRNGGAELIGSAQINSNRNIVLYLKQPNDFLYDVDQSLSTSSAPRFNSLNVSSNIQANFISANSAQFSSISGNLAGNASSADRLNKRLFLRLGGNLQTNYTEINLNSNQYDIFADINYFGDVAQHNYQQYSPNVTYYNSYNTYQCNSSGSCSNNFSSITNATLAGNSYNNSPTYPQYQISINGGATPTIVQTARKLESPAIINLTGDFISSVSGAFQGGETTNITLTSQGLTFAKDMDQYLRKSSEVTFSKITAGAGGVTINGPLTTQTLQVMNSATIANSLKILDGSGTGTIEMNGGSKFISFLGGGGNVTAQFFNGDLKGNADTATKLKNPIQLTVTGDLVGNSSTSDNINYNLNLTLANNTISTSKLQDFAITNSKIADNAVSTSKLQDFAITNSKIAENAISTSKLQDFAITNSKIAENAISTSKLQDLAISTSKIQDAAVTTGKLADNAISTSKLQDFAVTTAKIANGNITTEKLASGATIDNARALISPSDLRLKEGITTIEGLSLLERLSKINLFGYSFRDDPMHSRTLGVLAQELQPLFPELVTVQTEGKHAGYYAVNYGLMGALASAGVGHLNKKLDSLGLQIKDPRTLSATLPNFTVSNITAERIETKKLKAREIEAGKGNFEDLSSDKFSATNGKAVRMQADTINSGQTEGYAGLGSALPLFGGGMEGHYIVNVSSPDGSYATASVFVSGGQIHVVPMATQNISIVPSMGMVHAVANGKVLKATWLKTG